MNATMNVESQTVGEGNTKAVPVIDHFAQLGIERRYDVDKSDLEDRYLDRSKQVHPDRFVNAEAADRIAALSASMQLNESFKILKNDRLRAEHLLALHGVLIGGNEQLDPSFLMEILESREELAEAQQRGDTATVMRLEDGMLDRKDAALERIATLFESIRAGSADTSSAPLGEIKRELIVLRYVERYLEAALDESE